MLLSFLRTTWRGAHYLGLLALLTLAFDVSKECGLNYSLWLVSYYIATLVLRRFFSRGRLKLVVSLPVYPSHTLGHHTTSTLLYWGGDSMDLPSSTN